ncbi:MAG: hypothetical protein A2186_02355 [Candidatus Levybacteria bacterium RIFOXYA1_FULL_41_10]|nr:MAG: hypothetical protein A3J18_03290 [Candidatus Levybacteria bacterium RIFCSPLOWO2_02_FULL_40_18]OGH52632.1 MAG: hypothetical protein A2423_02475 [Candidatus Levybacteria bacterium RIFOXYC1_FULL_40_10]OGH52700.1 MAG: hypothetical protein A3H20_02145 [Candidatus Levybacteria bacterium RIFCSPLOWO2_12_FULL_41_12]OGH58226.1 MAG: hypothetical protein A2186_02355 [Candidatus Levybacteria bacterium RIFOXYA1_FULL_41_10]OGH70703.1 MAG: hypothetical protein A2396_00790 [Candidatus Levybacteria bacte
MTDVDFLGKYASILRKNVIALLLTVIGFVLVASGILSISSKSKKDIVFESKGASLGVNESRKIAVDVSGGVINPGLYQFSEGSRVQDGLAAAGGLSESADREWVEKNLNLALKLKDSQKIYIPKQGEELYADQGMTQEGLININTASPGNLDVLPGIGPVTAQKVIDNRPYGSIDELLIKKAVSKATFEKIKDKISAY